MPDKKRTPPFTNFKKGCEEHSRHYKARVRRTDGTPQSPEQRAARGSNVELSAAMLLSQIYYYQ